MARAPVNGIEIEYEIHGPDGAPPLLLIMGLGSQLISWDDGFVDALLDRGFKVIRYDNRDIGLSTWFDQAGLPDFAAVRAGDRSSVAYDLDDMADDAAALLDHLGIGSAHVFGASMGGMIAQQLASRYPHEVRTLTSFMSTTGAEGVGQPWDRGMKALFNPPRGTRDEIIATSVENTRAIWSDTDRFPFDEQRARRRAERAYDRAFHPHGTARQLAAVWASADRTEALKTIAIPTLVLHGDSDPLVDVSGGRATAEAIPGAELVIIEGLGHELHPSAWDTLADAAARHAGVTSVTR